MFKYMVVLCVVLACAFAAPQILINNEAAKQVGLPFANGWTDGPNNGVGPVVAYSAYTPVLGAQVLHHGIGAPVLHHGLGAQYIL